MWALLAAAALSPADGLAEGIRMTGELKYVNTENQTETKATGEETDSDHSRFSQFYNIELQKQIFPYVSFRSGLVLSRRRGKTTTDDLRTKRTDRNLAYFLELDLDNPTYGAGLTYRDSEDKTDGTNVADLKTFREEYFGSLHWRPEDRPEVSLNYRRTRAYDKPRTREIVSEFFTLASSYDYKNLALDYSYIRNDLDQRHTGSSSLEQAHDGRMHYTTRILGDRVSVTGGSQLTYRASERSDGEDIRLSTAAPLGAFYLLDDSTPESNTVGEFTTVDLSNPLIDVDIGPSGPRNLVSFGVEFSSPTRTDTVYVLPLEDATDPSLASPAEINAVADRFSWQVFSSDDQETWTELDVTRATYELFENRFEISFSSPANVSFIKVATEPLSGGGTPSILISQLRTLETVAGSAGATLRSFRQTYDVGLRSQLSRDTTATYQLYYMVGDQNLSAGRSTRLTNSIAFRHQFGTRLVGNTRVMRTVNRRPGEDDGVENSFSASLRADHLDTFYQTLTYSSRYDRGEEGSLRTNSVWLRNNMELHPNWSANLEFGYTRQSPLEGETSSGQTIRLASNLAPNWRTRFRADYRISWTKEKHERARREQRWGLQAFFLPTDVLSLFADFSYHDTGFDGHRFSQDYSVHWAPFPDGDLDLSLAYNRFENRSGRKSETVTPALTWQIRRGLVLTLTYTTGTDETDAVERDLDVFTGVLRFSF
jgi:hypothetical protein